MSNYTRWDQVVDPIWIERLASSILGRSSRAGFQLLSTLSGPSLVEGILAYDVDYEHLSCEEAIAIRQAQALFSKRKDLVLPDAEAVAYDKFMQSERLCRETNDIFKKRARGKFQFAPRVERALWHAQRKIASILGDVPDLSALKFKFGPGATTQIAKKNASPRIKLGTVPACSIELFRYRHLVLAEMPGWHQVLKDQDRSGSTLPLRLPVEPGKISFVPKSRKEFRTIMVEPSLNTMCQSGIGSYMADRLRTCGVDIRDQTKNQKLARKGSIDGSLATVDLSSASDTIATELVYDLLGLDWASWLARFRTGNAILPDGVGLQLEKFSSMGNGFTFPLETLIFYALAWGTCTEMKCASSHDVSAFGDDIIIPTEAYGLLCEVFTSCGFVINKAKSFAHGPFRESCGADYYLGTDIRPVYLKTGPCVFDLFRLHNFFFRNYDEDTCEFLVSLIDPVIRLYGPDGYGDGHLLGTWVRSKKVAHRNKQFGGYTFDTFTFRSRRSFISSFGDCVLPTYTTYLSQNDSIGSVTNPIRDGRTDRLESYQPSSTDHVVSWAKDGSSDFAVRIPGVSGVNRISIYTFDS